MELVESSRITRCAFIPNSFPKLGEVDEIPSDAAFVAEDPSEESDDRERTDDCVGEAGDGVWFLYVSSYRQGDSSSSSVSVLDEARGSRGRGGNTETEMEEGRGDLVGRCGDGGDNHHGCNDDDG